MLTLGFHNPFAVLGKEPCRRRARAPRARATGRAAARAVAEEPAAEPLRSADLASPRPPPKVTQASQSDGECRRHAAATHEDVAPMVEAGTPPLQRARQRRGRRRGGHGAPRRPQPRSPPKLDTGAGGGPRQVARSRARASARDVRVARAERAALHAAARRGGDGRRRPDATCSTTSAALDSADAVRGDLRRRRGHAAQRGARRGGSRLGADALGRRPARGARGGLPARRGRGAGRRPRVGGARGAAEVLSRRRELAALERRVGIVQGTAACASTPTTPRPYCTGRCGRSRTAAGRPGAAPRAAGDSLGGGGALRLGLAAAHGFALSVLTQSSVRAKLAAGDFERLERLCARIRGPVDASSTSSPRPAVGRDAPAGRGGRRGQNGRRRRRRAPPAESGRGGRAAITREGGTRGRAGRVAGGGAAAAASPPPCRRRSRSHAVAGPRGAGLADVRRRPNALAAAEVALTEVPLVGAAAPRPPRA